MTVPREMTRWRKASDGNNTCVELAHTHDAVRDSKNPTGPTLAVDTSALVAAVRAGKLDREW